MKPECLLNILIFSVTSSIIVWGFDSFPIMQSVSTGNVAPWCTDAEVNDCKKINCIKYMTWKVSAVSECGEQEKSFPCENEEICYGGSTGINANDVLCMVRHNCDTTYREDTCEYCEENPRQYTYGSKYKDCEGTCYEPDNMSSMKTVDSCMVCGGTNSTCSPTVSAIDIVLLPDTANTTFNITGTSLITPNLQIVLLRSTASPIKQKRSVKTAQVVLDIVTVYDETTLEVRVDNVAAGEYEVGARAGDEGEEYLEHSGPLLTFYAVSDYTVSNLSPAEQDLDGSDKVALTLQLDTTSADLSIANIYDITQKFKCYYSSSMDVALASGTRSSVVGTFNRTASTLECDLDIPDRSKSSWVCPSFDEIHLVGCQRIVFYELAPVPSENRLFFTEKGDGLYVDFVKHVSFNVSASCATYFTDIGTLGTDSRCLFDEDGLRLSVIFGDDNRASPDDTLELRAGLRSRDGEFKRASEAVALTLAVSQATKNATEHIEIATLGSWPERLTSSAESPINLKIQLIKFPGNRPPESITWTVNDVEKESAKDKLELELDVTSTGTYKIFVVATDFLGGESNITHTITKTDINLPSIVFTPTGVKQSSGRHFIIHPNTVFNIYTTIYYVGAITDYHFQWKRDENNVDGEYTYTSSTEETSVDMCGDTVIYSLVVSRANDNSNSIEYSITMVVECRDPVARITGNDMVNVDVSQKDFIVYGNVYDLDGGTVSHEWTCTTLSDMACIDRVTSSKTSGATKPKVTVSPSRMTAGKKYAIYLTASVEKKGVLYTHADKVKFAVQAGDKPVLVDEQNTAAGKKSRDGFAWYSIRPGVLKPGSRHKIEIKVTNELGLYSTDERDIYIYELLRGCSVEASAMVELGESSISLRNCDQDPDVAWRSTTCTAGNKELQLSSTLSFIVPSFKQDLNSFVLKCKIMDSVGNVMYVNSSEVPVTKAAGGKTVTQAIERLKETGDMVGALTLVSEMADGEEEETDESFNTQAASLIDQIVKNDHSNDDIHRSLKSYSRIKVEKVQENEKDILAENLITMLNELCRVDQQSEAIAFNADHMKNMLQNTKRLMETTKKVGPLFKVAEDRLACIKFKLMQSEDSQVVQLEDGTEYTYIVNALDDIEDNYDIDVKFPNDLKSKFRELWSCKESEVCDNVAIKKAKYKSEPPHLLYDRKDKDCSQYVILDLYNPGSGHRIPVRELEGTIDINLGSECNRGKCWYYDDLLKRYSQDGITTGTGTNGSTECHTRHLTAFTVRSEPELYNGTNLPYIISVGVGCVLLLVSAVVLLKLFLVIKHRANAVDDKTHLDLDDVHNTKENYPTKRENNF